MVHIVTKKIGNHEYLYLQKSYHIKGKGGKKRTKHVAYLGKAIQYTKNDLNNILYTANNCTKGDLNKLLNRYHKKHMEERKQMIKKLQKVKNENK